MLEVGKPVVVCLTKMQTGKRAGLIEHFQKEVLDELPRGRVASLAIPYLPADELADPSIGRRYRIPLLNQVLVLGEPAADARRRTVQSALRLSDQRPAIDSCAVARDDVAAWTIGEAACAAASTSSTNATVANS